MHTRASPPVQVYDAGGKFIRGWGEGVVGSAHYLKIDVDSKGNIYAGDITGRRVQKFVRQK
ncbi:unnamed protein product [marine sediment metagenome]|uniref:Uncharacterized protein n=1 Tax=marine sediment metagenome TaxID=412755 RepID=X0WAL0_9ZZZZ